MCRWHTLCVVDIICLSFTHFVCQWHPLIVVDTFCVLVTSFVCRWHIVCVVDILCLSLTHFVRRWHPLFVGDTFFASSTSFVCRWHSLLSDICLCDFDIRCLPLTDLFCVSLLFLWVVVIICVTVPFYLFRWHVATFVNSKELGKASWRRFFKAGAEVVVLAKRERSHSKRRGIRLYTFFISILYIKKTYVCTCIRLNKVTCYHKRHHLPTERPGTDGQRPSS